jgi:hypothetical protein
MRGLASLNTWLSTQEKKQLWMLYGAVVVGVILAGYYFLAMPLEDKRQQLARSITALEKQKNDIDRSHQASIKALESLLEQTKQRKAQTQERVTQMQTVLAANPALHVKETSWANLLELVLKRSVELSVAINVMEITSPQTPFVGELYLVKTLHIEGEGAFLNIERLMRFIESHEKTLKLSQLVIREGEAPRFQATFEVLGVLP